MLSDSQRTNQTRLEKANALPVHSVARSLARSVKSLCNIIHSVRDSKPLLITPPPLRPNRPSRHEQAVESRHRKSSRFFARHPENAHAPRLAFASEADAVSATLRSNDELVQSLHA